MISLTGRDLEALQAVASASLARSLADFEKALKDYSEVTAVGVGVQVTVPS